jgi:hypothetical protein
MGERKPKFRKFLLSLSQQLRDDDVKHLKFLYGDDIPTAELEKVKTGLELFSLCLNRDMISADNLEDFIDDLKTIKRNDLVDRCEVYMRLKISGKSCSYLLTFLPINLLPTYLPTYLPQS